MSFKEINLLMVEFNRKFLALVPKSHIGVFKGGMINII
jgi:hypothetical protein